MKTNAKPTFNDTYFAAAASAAAAAAAPADRRRRKKNTGSEEAVNDSQRIERPGAKPGLCRVLRLSAPA